MKFTVTSVALFSRLQAISRVISSKNSIAILDCFLLQVKEGILYMTASDNETTLTTSIEVMAADGDGNIAIPSKTLLDALKEISDQPLSFDINLETYEILVQYLNGKYSMMGKNADEYPETQLPGDDAISLNLPTPILLDGINKCSFATADDELRPVMNGIYFDILPECLTLVSSDGHKLVRDKILSIQSNPKSAFILPKKPANLLKNLLGKEEEDTHILFDNRKTSFIFGNTRMTCRLIEGKYPPYNAVIPQNNPNKVIVDRLAILSALKRVSVFASQTNNLVKLELSSNQIQISSKDIDFSTSAEETIACEFNGADLSIGFKASYLIEILNNIGSTNVVFELADPSKAGIVVPEEQVENEDLLMLLMPMMLNY